MPPCVYFNECLESIGQTTVVDVKNRIKTLEELDVDYHGGHSMSGFSRRSHLQWRPFVTTVQVEWTETPDSDDRTTRIAEKEVTYR